MLIKESNSPLFKERDFYRPFQYPWAYERWLDQQRGHWLFDEFPLAEDLKDWQAILSPSERNLLTQIFRFFTQSDVGVGNCYMDFYIPTFKPCEIKMMLTAFSNAETIHMAAYDHLIQTIGLPEVEYQAFLKCKEMSRKWDFMKRFGGNTVRDVAFTLAIFGGFIEGLQLFASFAILMNFPRFGKMKAMGQIVTWSIRDESLHILSVIDLFYSVINEHKFVWNSQFKDDILDAAKQVVSNEDAFIDVVFEMGPVQGMTKQDVKQYIRFIANRRVKQLGISDAIYPDVKDNPFPWMDEINGEEFSNFFEQRGTAYSKGSSQGSWENVF